jgi:signal transduction histidine kinase
MFHHRDGEPMRTRQRAPLPDLDLLLPWLVLLVLGYYTYLEIAAPYIGFSFSATSAIVQDVFANHSSFDLQIGHQLVAVGARPMDEWQQRLRLHLLPPLKPGDLLDLQVRHEQGVAHVVWPVPGLTPGELADRLLNVWWLGVAFWLAGTATLLLVRPKDGRSRLFAAFFLLTALWLVVGNTSRWGHGQSRLVFRTAIWLSLPVIWHVHWTFPRPLAQVPRWVLSGLYLAGLLLAVLQWLEQVPVNLYASAFALTLAGSLALLGVHFIRQPDERSRLRLLLAGFGLAIVPVVLLGLLSSLGSSTRLGAMALLFLPILPGAYFYAVFRYRLGQSELRANRLVAVYLFLVLLGTATTVGTGLLSLLPDGAGTWAFFATVMPLLAALVAVYGFPPFTRWVERRLLAMPLPPAQLVEAYLARITTSLTQTSLVRLLQDEVLPTLLIRQSALFWVRHGQLSPLYPVGADDLPAGLVAQMTSLQPQEVYRIPAAPGQPRASWVRLGLPLHFEGRLIGVWLLGEHDPDDHYAQGEIALLQTLARQTALALANMEQAAQLQLLYQASIDRQEAERTGLAHILHDEVLSQAAILYTSLDAPLSERVETAYALLKQHIRQLIAHLRPPALDFGLVAALEELVVELERRAQPTSAVHLTISASPSAVHYPAQVENQLFRIVQQACENALHHAHAQTIALSGSLAPDQIHLCVADDGIGFLLSQPLDLASLLAHRHFGLVHMHERAASIGAVLVLESVPGQGTRVCLDWSSDTRDGA